MMQLGLDSLILVAVIAAIVGLAFVIPSFAPYRKPMPIVALLLGISSGFPLTLLLGTMAYWLSKVGIDKSTIGFAIGLTTPYTLKFLWAPLVDRLPIPVLTRSEEHTSELQSLMRISYAVCCLNKKTLHYTNNNKLL